MKRKTTKKQKPQQKFHLLPSLTVIVLAIVAGFIWHFATAKNKITNDVYDVTDEYSEESMVASGGFNFEFSAQNFLAPQTAGIRVPILIYHIIRDNSAGESDIVHRMTVPPAMFDKELQYLKDNNYHVIPFNDLVDNLLTNKPLPSKPIILTFDDGWEMQYKTALPILNKYGDTATFFIFSGGIGKTHYLTWDEVLALQNNGMTIGGHSKTHPTLVDITDDNVLRDELISSKKVIESHIGKPVDLFAYPYGHPNDQIIKILKEAGYKAARTTYLGSVHDLKDIYTIKGIIVDQDFNKFVASLNY